MVFFFFLVTTLIRVLTTFVFIIVKPNLSTFTTPSSEEKVWKMMDSLLTPSTFSHMQTPATTFDHEDFLNHIFASAPWPSVDETHAPQPPPSDGFLDSRNQQIMMMPLSSHHQNDNVDGSSAHALYNGFSATGSRPFHIPQVINLNKSLSLSRFRS